MSNLLSLSIDTVDNQNKINKAFNEIVSIKGKKFANIFNNCKIISVNNAGYNMYFDYCYLREKYCLSNKYTFVPYKYLIEYIDNNNIFLQRVF